MNYEAELLLMLVELYRESWMDDDDWQQCVLAIEEVVGVTTAEMAKQIEVGVANGYDAEFQMKLLRAAFSQKKQDDGIAPDTTEDNRE